LHLASTPRNFGITTNVNELIATGKSTGYQSQKAYEAVFPEHKLLVVIEAPTPELADQAADKLAKSLPARSDVLQLVGFFCAASTKPGAVMRLSTSLEARPIRPS
jgi:hypothetical protein